MGDPAGADSAVRSRRNDLAAGSSASEVGTPGLARGRFDPRGRVGGSPFPAAVRGAEAAPSAPTDVPPVAACGDNVIAVFMAATAAAMPTREGLGGDLVVAMGVRLPPAAGGGVVVGVCSCGTTAETLADTRVAVAGVPFRIVAFVEALVDRTAGGVASLDAANANDAAVACVSFARLVDGAEFGDAALRVLAPRLDAADGADVGDSLGFLASGALGGNRGLLAAAGFRATRALAGGGLRADGGLVAGGVLAAAKLLGAGGGLGAPPAEAAASCLAAIDLTDRATVPASGFAGALDRRGGAAAIDRPCGGARAPTRGAAPPSLAPSTGW